MLKKINNERGIALVLALLVLAILTLLGLAAVLTSTTDIQIATNEKIAAQGQYGAEAGIPPLLVGLNATPSGVNEPTPAPVFGVANVTAQNWKSYGGGQIHVGSLLINYTSMVEYKKVDAGRKYSGRVAFCNQSSGYTKCGKATATPRGGFPIYKITSAARNSVGSFRTQEVVLEVTKSSFNYNIQGGISARGDLDMSGNATVDGRKHNVNGVLCSTNPIPVCSCPFTNLSGAKPWAYTSGVATSAGSANPFGSTGEAPTNNGNFTPNNPWEALGMNETDFTAAFETHAGQYTWNAAVNQTLYLTGGGGEWNYANNLTGTGILVVHNPLFIPGVCEVGVCAPQGLKATGGTWKGIIIADYIDLRGNLTIDGAVISLTTLNITKFSGGNPTINYSCDAISQFAGGKINQKLNWHEQ